MTKQGAKISQAKFSEQASEALRLFPLRLIWSWASSFVPFRTICIVWLFHLDEVLIFLVNLACMAWQEGSTVLRRYIFKPIWRIFVSAYFMIYLVFFIGQLLPSVFKATSWGILHTLLEMFSYRLHHIQPHYRIQLLSQLHTVTQVPQTNLYQLHLWSGSVFYFELFIFNIFLLILKLTGWDTVGQFIKFFSSITIFFIS